MCFPEVFSRTDKNLLFFLLLYHEIGKEYRRHRGKRSTGGRSEPCFVWGSCGRWGKLAPFFPVVEIYLHSYLLNLSRKHWNVTKNVCEWGHCTGFFLSSSFAEIFESQKRAFFCSVGTELMWSLWNTLWRCPILSVLWDSPLLLAEQRRVWETVCESYYGGLLQGPKSAWF